MKRQFTQTACKGDTRLGALAYRQYPAGRERGLLVTGGAEKKSELKGSIVTWGARELAEMEEERQKYREIEDRQGGWRESILTGNRWQREAGWESGKK